MKEDVIDTLDTAGDAESTLTWLRSLLAELLSVEIDEVATDQPLGELGIDSLTAAQFSFEIEESTGVTAPLERFLGDHTLTDVAGELAALSRARTDEEGVNVA
ncbi:acyl carrier protein [Micromonospora sp. NPDC023888]|uniref:acyl carrier protein n=1 Tax=Micromonospora sp. NPDC023888 TaxID=3155607 RepID=UPI0033F79A3E